MWKAARKKCQVTYIGKPIKITADLKAILKSKEGMEHVFQSLRENNSQPRFLHPAKMSFIIEEEIKTFHNKQKLKQHCRRYSKEFNTQKRKIKATMKIWEKMNRTR
jgi:hypothetical protein